MAEIHQTKKYDQVADGKLLVKSTVVTDSLHFFDQSALDDSNRRIGEHIERVSEISQVSLSELTELIGYIKNLKM